jgi:hypothetical protein
MQSLVAVTQDTDSTDKEVDFMEVCDMGRSVPCQVALLRYMYGLPLCKEDERMSAVDLSDLCDAALDFGVPGLQEHALLKLEELLVGLLDGIAMVPDGSRWSRWMVNRPA